MKDALRRVEGAFSIVAMTRSKLIGVRDPLGVRPLMLGRVGDGLGARLRDLRPRHHRRRVRPRDRARRDGDLHRPRASRASSRSSRRQAALLHLREGLFLPPRQRDRRPLGLRDPPPHRRGTGQARRRSRPTSSARSPTAARRPRSATASRSGIPYAMGIIRNQYMGRTFIEPTEQIRNMGVRLKLNVNRAVDRRQARRAGRRLGRARHHQPQDPRDGDGGRRRRGAFPHRLAADRSGPASTASTRPSATSCSPRR